MTAAVLALAWWVVGSPHAAAWADVGHEAAAPATVIIGSRTDHPDTTATIRPEANPVGVTSGDRRPIDMVVDYGDPPLPGTAPPAQRSAGGALWPVVAVAAAAHLLAGAGVFSLRMADRRRHQGASVEAARSRCGQPS